MSDAHPISEGNEYGPSLQKALSEEGVDHAAAARVLAVLQLTLEKSPYEWRKVPNTKRLYMAITRRVTTADGFVPALHVMFSIADSGEVTLLHVDIHYIIL
jgi:hypothetical protein